MTTNEEMSGYYADMTGATRDLASKQKWLLTSSVIGNGINAAAAVNANRNARRSQTLLAETRDVVRDGFDRLDEGLQDLRDSVDAMHADMNAGFETMSHINYALWRDGVGRGYSREFRPRALNYLRDYEEACEHWLDMVAERVARVVADFPGWKRPEWRDDALRTGLFFTPPRKMPPPQPLPDPVQKEPPPRMSMLRVLVLTFVCWFAAYIGVCAFVGMPIRIYDEAVNGPYLSTEPRVIDPIPAISTVALILLPVIFGLMWLRRRRKEARAREVEEYNAAQRRAHEEAELAARAEVSAHNGRLLRDWEAANGMAREEAIRYVAERVGVRDPRTNSLAEDWASEKTRREVQRLRKIIENERTRPPEPSTLTRPEPYTVNRRVRRDMRAELQRFLDSLDGFNIEPPRYEFE